MSAFRICRSLIGLVRPMTGWMILAVFLGVLGFAATVAIPVGAAAAIVLVLSGQTAHLTAIFVIMAVCALARALLRYGEQACNHYIAFRLLARIRDLLFGKLRSLSLSRLDGHDKGDLIALITSDVELLEVFYAHTISPVCIALICAVLFTLAGFWIHPLIGLVLLASYVISGLVIPTVIGKQSRQAGRGYRGKAAGLSQFVLENIIGMKENLQFGLTGKKIDEIEERTCALADEEEKIKTMQAMTSSLMQWVVTGFGLLMLAVCLFLVSRQAMTPSMTVVALVLQESTFGPFAALANLGTGLAQTLGAGERVLRILEEKPTVPEVSEGPEAVNGDINLNSVSFSYPQTQTEVLDHFSLDVNQGTLLGISGPSGCGKSTLLKLLMRFYDPQTGSITLSGSNLKAVRTQSLLDQEAMMSQDTFLFEGTVLDNLKIARPEATMEEIGQACKMAALHETILGFDEGYQTVIAGKGRALSAGERQRVGLAKAFLSARPILLLDEPTSNLDALSEGAIMKSTVSHSRGRTILLVSHKKGTLRFADRNLVMKPAANQKNQKAALADH